MPGSSCWVDSLKMWIELNVKGNSDRSIATVWVPKWSLEKKKQIKICWVVEGKEGEKCREGEVARASKVQPRNGREGRAQRDGVRVTLLSVKALQLAQLLPHLPPPPLPTPILSVLYSLFWGEGSLGGEGYNTLYLWSIMPHATSLYRTRYHTTTSSPSSLLPVYFPPPSLPCLSSGPPPLYVTLISSTSTALILAFHHPVQSRPPKRCTVLITV